MRIIFPKNLNATIQAKLESKADNEQLKAKFRELRNAQKDPERKIEAKKLRDEIVNKKVGLVRAIVCTDFSGNKQKIDDLIQYGSIGLIKAVDAYDPDNIKNANFTTFAIRPIRWAILDGLTEMKRLVKIDNEDLIVKKIRLIKKAEEKFQTRYGRLPDNEELAKAIMDSQAKKEPDKRTEVLPEDIDELKLMDVQEISIEKPIHGDEKRCLKDRLSADKFTGATESLTYKELVEKALRKEQANNPRGLKAFILSQLYEKSQAEIATGIGISRGGTGQVIRKAAQRLRKSIGKNPFKF